MSYGTSNLCDESWWHHAAGHERQLVPKVGVRADVCMVIYLKYMFGVTGMSRIVLWFMLSFLKSYPRQGCFDDLNARGVHHGDRWIRRLVHRGIDHLYLRMHEIGMDHAFHPNNHNCFGLPFQFERVARDGESAHCQSMCSVMRTTYNTWDCSPSSHVGRCRQGGGVFSTSVFSRGWGVFLTSVLAGRVNTAFPQKSNVALNASLPQASYPCGNFSDTVL